MSPIVKQDLGPLVTHGHAHQFCLLEIAIWGKIITSLVWPHHGTTCLTILHDELYQTYFLDLQKLHKKIFVCPYFFRSCLLYESCQDECFFLNPYFDSKNRIFTSKSNFKHWTCRSLSDFERPELSFEFTTAHKGTTAARSLQLWLFRQFFRKSVVTDDLFVHFCRSFRSARSIWVIEIDVMDTKPNAISFKPLTVVKKAPNKITF